MKQHDLDELKKGVKTILVYKPKTAYRQPHNPPAKTQLNRRFRMVSSHPTKWLVFCGNKYIIPWFYIIIIPKVGL